MRVVFTSSSLEQPLNIPFAFLPTLKEGGNWIFFKFLQFIKIKAELLIFVVSKYSFLFSISESSSSSKNSIISWVISSESSSSSKYSVISWVAFSEFSSKYLVLALFSEFSSKFSVFSVVLFSEPDVYDSFSVPK